MPPRKTARISARKQPKQSRSAALVAAILDAAVQVLAKEGAQRFTTARVAEKAGVSIGSLYQYFPNKAAILFRLQSDEWHQTAAMLRALLEDETVAPRDRLRRLVHAFLHSECAEAAVRMALDDAAPLYRDTPEARAAHAPTHRIFDAYLRGALPTVPPGRRTLAGTLITTTLGAVGKQFSQSPRTTGEIDAYAEALADMLCAYLDGLARPAKPVRRRSTHAPNA